MNATHFKSSETIFWSASIHLVQLASIYIRADRHCFFFLPFSSLRRLIHEKYIRHLIIEETKKKLFRKPEDNKSNFVLRIPFRNWEQWVSKEFDFRHVWVRFGSLEINKNW